MTALVSVDSQALVYWRDTRDLEKPRGAWEALEGKVNAGCLEYLYST